MKIAKAAHYEVLDLSELGVETIRARRENLVADFAETLFPPLQFRE